jgi:3-carboxy-cis,cis-muconate cycloisomerase
MRRCSLTSPDFGLLDPLDADGRSSSLVGDAAWLQAMVDVEVALIRALLHAKLVPESMETVAAGLAHATDLDAAAIARTGRDGGNPVIPLVKQLGARAEALEPGASDSVHVGATSQDILDSAAMLIARRSIAAIDSSLRSLAADLATLANLHRGTPMAGRTLGQHAAPTSFGLVVAGWLDGILAARGRLDTVAANLPLSFGGSVGTLAVLMDVARSRRPDVAAQQVVDEVLADLARLLGLRNPELPWHTNRVPVVEIAAALAAVVGAIGTMAVDIGLLSRTEIAEVSERLGEGEGSSSAMPHKRNPVTSVLLVASAHRAPGLASTVLFAQVAEDQRPSGAWHLEWTALRGLERLAVDASSAAASLGRRLEVDVERMSSNLELTDGLIYSERVSTVLAESIGKADAFELVAAASREAVETHRPLRVVVSARLASADEGVRARVWAAFDPDGGLGASGALIDRVLARAKEIA